MGKGKGRRGTVRPERSADPLVHATRKLHRNPRSEEAWLVMIHGTRRVTLAWLIRSLGLSRLDAEDCYQNAVLKTLAVFAVGSPPTFCDGSQVVGYIMRACLNEGISALRRERRHRDAITRFWRLRRSGPPPTDPRAAELYGEWLANEMQLLPVRLRRALELRLAGKSHAQIAPTLGIREGHVRVLVHRAIARLRRSVLEGLRPR